MEARNAGLCLQPLDQAATKINLCPDLRLAGRCRMCDGGERATVHNSIAAVHKERKKKKIKNHFKFIDINNIKIKQYHKIKNKVFYKSVI